MVRAPLHRTAPRVPHPFRHVCEEDQHRVPRIQPQQQTHPPNRHLPLHEHNPTHTHHGHTQRHHVPHLRRLPPHHKPLAAPRSCSSSPDPAQRNDPPSHHAPYKHHTPEQTPQRQIIMPVLNRLDARRQIRRPVPQGQQRTPRQPRRQIQTLTYPSQNHAEVLLGRQADPLEQRQQEQHRRDHHPDLDRRRVAEVHRQQARRIGIVDSIDTMIQNERALRGAGREAVDLGARVGRRRRRRRRRVGGRDGRDGRQGRGRRERDDDDEQQQQPW